MNLRTCLNDVAGDRGGDWLSTQFAEIALGKGAVYKSIKRMKVQKFADECGLLQEVLKHALDSFIDALVARFRDWTGRYQLIGQKHRSNLAKNHPC